MQLVKVITGHKDSLDHQMAIYLGMFMSKSKEDDYCVISGDMAFSDVVTFYRRKKYRIYRVHKCQSIIVRLIIKVNK